jgi:hypothetical protein
MCRSFLARPVTIRVLCSFVLCLLLVAGCVSLPGASGSQPETFPRPWPLSPFSDEQVAAVRACDLDQLREERYPTTIPTESLTKTVELVTPCDWAVLATAFAERAKGNDPLPAGREALRQALTGNPAFMLADRLFYSYFGALELVTAPPQAQQLVHGVRLTYAWSGLGDPVDPFWTEISQADSEPLVTGTAPKQPEPPELKRLTQGLGAALTDLVPVDAPVSLQPCTDNYPDWRVTLTFADGSTLDLENHGSNALGLGGPWQTQISGQRYLQVSPTFAKALSNLVIALDLPLGEPAAWTCFGDPVLDKAFPGRK